MKRILELAGWPLALVLLVVVVHQRIQAGHRVDGMAQRNQSIVTEEAEELDLERAVVDVPPVSHAPRRTTQMPEGNSDQVRVPPEAADAAKEGSDGRESPLSAMVGLMRSMGGDPASPQSRMMFETQYGELMDLLDLEPERSEAVRRLLTEELDRSIGRAGDLLSGGREALRKQLHETRSNPPRGVREELSQYLSDGELAVYDEYQTGEAERNSRRQYGMQIGLFAPNLSAETREKVLRVMVEEDLASRERDSPREFRQIETLDRVVERLNRMLEPQEQAAITRFLTIQYTAAEMAAQMMEQRAIKERDAP